MKQALFYLLESDTGSDELNAMEMHTCHLAADAWRIGQRVLIMCADKAQALKIDEALWQRGADEFVPHNLTGENDSYATPIEISWQEQVSRKRYDVLISLLPEVAPIANNFKQVIDFVPAADNLKQAARDRYRQYQQLGFELDTDKINQ